MVNSLIIPLEDAEITLLVNHIYFYFSYVQFAAQEEKRQKNERMAQHQKHENQMRDLQLQCEANVRELHQLQVEGKHQDKAGGRRAAQVLGKE